MRKIDDQRISVRRGGVRHKPVRHHLDLVQLRAARLGLDAMVGAGSGDALRCQHADAVASGSRQRNGNEEVRRAGLDEPQRAEHHTARQIPADVHVAEHELHRKGVTREADAEGAAHCAVRSVAADHVAGSRVLCLAVGSPQPHRDAGFILAQRCQFAAVFDSDAEPAEMACEHPLRLGLRHAELAVRADRGTSPRRR